MRVKEGEAIAESKEYQNNIQGCNYVSLLNLKMKAKDQKSTHNNSSRF